MRVSRKLFCVATMLLVAATIGMSQDASSAPAAAAPEKAAITGTISDQAGKGLGAAEITAKPDAGASQTVTADGQGLYAITDIAPGKYNVSVAAHGGKVFQSDIILSPGQVLTLSVSGGDVSAAATSTVPATQEKAAITGTVSNQAGAGIGGAQIVATPENGASQTITADGQGLYAVTDLIPGKYNIAVATGGAKIFQSNVALSSGQVLTLGLSGAPVAQTLSLNTAPPPAAAPSAQAASATPAAPSPSAEAPASAPQASATAAPSAGTGPAKISGNVTDPSGAVIPGAEVKLTGPGGAKTTVSDDKGNYVFNDVAPGTYTLTVGFKGFGSFVADNISIAAGSDIPLDASLAAAGSVEHVDVTAGGPAVIELENPTVSGTITEEEIKTTPLNGRNFTQLIGLVPGVSNQTGQDEAKVGVNGSVKYSVNGGRVEYNSFEVDGGDVLNAGLSGAESTLVVYPSLDAIGEVKVLTSNYGAQYGRTASGTVMVTTKSGGAKWHGGGYEFFRNEDLNARNYFDQTRHAPKYRRNDFGFTIGGPVTIPGHYNLKKDKTFAFFSEEVRLENSPSELQPDFNHAVPTAAERQGNFSDVCPSPNDPQDLSKLIVSGGSYLFPIASYPDCPRVPNGAISSPGYGLLFSSGVNGQGQVLNNLAMSGTEAALDPNGTAILNQNLIPLPNSYTGCNSSLVGQLDHTTGLLIKPCYVAVISEPTYWREELFRIDHNVTAKTRASFRYIHDAWDTTTPTPNWGTVTNTFPTVQNRFVGPGISLVASLTQSITPSLLNEFVVSFSNSYITLANVNGPGGANFTRPAALGDPAQRTACLAASPININPNCPMGYIFNNGFGGKVPGVVVTGNNQAYGGSGFVADPSYAPWEHTNPAYSLRDDVSKVYKKHTLQFGVLWVIAQKNETNGALEAATGDTQGLLSFSNVNGGLLDTGNAFANLIAYNTQGNGNAIQSYTQDSTKFRYHNDYQTVEPYFQDDWKVTPHLTVNLGLRVSLFGDYTENDRRAYNWDPQAFSRTLAADIRVNPNSGLLLDNKGKTIPITLGAVDPRIINGIVQCGTNGVPRGCIKNNYFNSAPRIGFAWDPRGDGKNSIRAGYGMFFEHGTGDEANSASLEGSAPLVLSLTQPFPSAYVCIGTTVNTKGACQYTAPQAFPINVTSIPTSTPWPYSQQWSLSVQRELPKNFVTTFAYVGSRGTHLTVERQLNQLQPVAPEFNPFALNEPITTNLIGFTKSGGDCLRSGPSNDFNLANGTVVSPQNPAYTNLLIACQGVPTASSANIPIPVANYLRPYLGIGKIFSLQNAGVSTYHGFQTTLRRTQGPLTAGVAYSYSHSIDDSSDRTDPTFVNSLDLRSNKASSNFDQRHLLNISYAYTLPNIAQRVSDYLSSGDEATGSAPSSPSRLARLVGQGWEVSGITTYQSGTPFSVVNQGSASTQQGVIDNAGVANGVGVGSYPDRNPHPSPALLKNNPGSFGPLLLNPNEFIAPRGLTFGNAGRNVLNNPNRLNFDMSLLKHIVLHEGSEIELRAEAFNVFNHTQFRIYNPDLHNTGSNTVSCYGGSDNSAGAYFPGGQDCLTGNSFLHPVDAHRPRTLQLAIKYNF